VKFINKVIKVFLF